MRLPKYRVIVNPTAGEGDNRGFFAKEVAPIFHLAAIDYEAKYTRTRCGRGEG